MGPRRPRSEVLLDAWIQQEHKGGAWAENGRAPAWPCPTAARWARGLRYFCWRPSASCNGAA